ncbi:MAG: DinB family protein [Armatimonadetes bacterium]|nr:DinB family protein [Armatimonadota bacterium]
MSAIQRYRDWFEQERDSNQKMLSMIRSVPVSARSDARFSQALQLAGHLAACRENWLDRMLGDGTNQGDWWPESVDIESLPGRFEVLEEAWSIYLKDLADDRLDMDFEFPVQGGAYRWNIEGQIMQMVGHGFYHRGQIALLVQQLGGEPVDTDYLYWAFQQQPDRWKRLP